MIVQKFMKNTYKIASLISLGAALLIGRGYAATINVTVEDPNKGGGAVPTETSTGWYKGDDGIGGNAPYLGLPAQSVEYMEVEPGMAQAHAWDLVAFTANHDVISNQSIGILSGFNLKDGYQGMTSGDVFISTNRTAVINWMDNYDFNQQSNNNGAPGVWNYALRPNFGGGTYDIYALSSTTMFDDTYYWNNPNNYNAPSNPWRIVANTATLIGTQSLNYSTTKTAAQASALAGFSVVSTPYYAEFNHVETFLAGQNDVYMHFTMLCGNDNLMGQDTAGFLQVPDNAATLILLGVSLLGLLGIGRYTKR
jgi:hypothetical protein